MIYTYKHAFAAIKVFDDNGDCIATFNGDVTARIAFDAMLDGMFRAGHKVVDCDTGKVVVGTIGDMDDVACAISCQGETKS